MTTYMPILSIGIICLIGIGLVLQEIERMNKKKILKKILTELQIIRIRLNQLKGGDD